MKPKRLRLLMCVAGVAGAIFVLVGVLIYSRPKPVPAIHTLLRKDPQSELVTVAEVIEDLALDEKAADYSDEPPGKLRSLCWSKVKLPNTDTAVDVQIDIVYTPNVFSTTGEWDTKAVRAATVTKVTISPETSGK